MGGSPQFPVLGDLPLVPETPPRPSFAQRIQRAHDLSGRYPAASEILGFYVELAFYQEHVYDSLGRIARESAREDNGEFVEGSWPMDPDVALPLFPVFARSLGGVAPPGLRERALKLADSDTVGQRQLLTRFWTSAFARESTDTAAADRFLALAFLQPYAEWLAQSGHSIAAATQHATCPVCGSEPICSVLRDRGHGAGRSLVCSLCMHEWSFLRVACPACGEDRFESLPVYTPEAIPQVRVNACDTCHHYLKTIDMTKDGLAVPVVDELAAVALDLWAAENNYHKLTPNLAGL